MRVTNLRLKFRLIVWKRVVVASFPPRRAAFRGVRDGLRGTSHFHVAMALVTR
jgi:hypothetical protein